jgi:hypothetical protein
MTKRRSKPKTTESLLAQTIDLAIGCTWAVRKVATNQRTAMREIHRDTNRLLRKATALRRLFLKSLARKEGSLRP